MKSRCYPRWFTGAVTDRCASAKPLQNPRLRSSVSICANVVLATHGKTVSGEVLGSGDAGQKNQRFQLAIGPAYLSVGRQRVGAQSTLSIRVSGVLWHPVSSLLAEDGRSRCYVVSHDADEPHHGDVWRW